MNDTPDIIFFGGTFDPPHAGHKDCVRLAREKFPQAKILIVPALAPASAGQPAKQPTLAFNERMTLCRLAFESSEPGVEVSNIEAKLPVPNYTLNTAVALGKEFPGKALGLLLGMDQFTRFLQWKSPLELAARVHLLVVGRSEPRSKAPEGEGPRHPAGDPNAAFEQHLKELQRAFASSSDNLTLKQVYFLPGLTSPASSTALKAALSTSGKAPEGWLAPSVEAYIKKENAYSGDQSL